MDFDFEVFELASNFVTFADKWANPQKNRPFHKLRHEHRLPLS